MKTVERKSPDPFKRQISADSAGQSDLALPTSSTGDLRVLV